MQLHEHIKNTEPDSMAPKWNTHSCPYICRTAKYGEDILHHGQAILRWEDFQYGGFDIELWS